MACCEATPMRRRTSAAWSTTSKPATRRLALGRVAQRGEDADGGGLAGAVVAEQAEHGAGRHVEVEVAEGPEVVEALAEPLGPDAGCPSTPAATSLFVWCTTVSYIVRPT